MKFARSVAKEAQESPCLWWLLHLQNYPNGRKIQKKLALFFAVSG